jgi:hypothetical protein
VKRIWSSIGLLALIAAACQAETPASAGAECSSDANCALGSWTADCCPRCKPFSAPSEQVADMDARCRAMSPVSGRCPELKCPEHLGPDYIAKCVSGQCVVGP